MRHSWVSWVGIALGAIALAVAAVHVAAGPFDREPPLEEVVTDKAKSIYDTLRQQFAGAKPAVESRPSPSVDRRGIDRWLRAATAGCGAVAVALAFAGFTRRENPRACGSAAVLGVAAMPLLLSLGILVAALMVSLAWRLLPGPGSVPGAQSRSLAAAAERDQARL